MSSAEVTTADDDRTLVEYQVRLTGTGRVVEQGSTEDVEIARDAWFRAGFRAYVVWVEFVGGQWVALED